MDVLYVIANFYPIHDVCMVFISMYVCVLYTAVYLASVKKLI